MNPLHYIFLGGGMLCVAFVLRRTAKRAQSNQTSTALTQPPVTPRNRVSDRLQELELRLYDFSREVEGRMETKLTVLDELIAEADREIIELRQAIPPERSLELPTRPHSSLSADQIHMADCLFGAGFQVDEIARAMNCKPAEIARELAIDPPDSAAA
ncbi:MAG: hypothetical protein O3A00_12650 [Planctomycetota bacterium]|nr:hypothetical protein [Planctomycetota bacterium]